MCEVQWVKSVRAPHSGRRRREEWGAHRATPYKVVTYEE
jgi:hypothetical protein